MLVESSAVTLVLLATVRPHRPVVLVVARTCIGLRKPALQNGDKPEERREKHKANDEHGKARMGVN